MPDPFLSIKNIKKFYRLPKQPPLCALQGVSFEIFEGEVLGLLGVNGAGKTTLSSIIATLTPPSTGELLWKGLSVYKQLPAYRRSVGFCPQKPNLDQLLSLEENLLFAGRFFGMEEKAVRQQTQMLIDRLGLGAYAQAQASMLSGGYKQRFLIARSLIQQPKLVILDEPTVGLDPHIRHELWQVIRDLRSSGVTLILTTHYLEEAEALCDRVCMIDQGSIKSLDTPKNLLRTYDKHKLEDVLLAIRNEGKSS
ncbi:MAG: ABC transporter ATP-binding protein [Verrucomicrobia bacterium]|nr:ABC transporter ATP-binding protein [Verrucomicrobiota bacterium]